MSAAARNNGTRHHLHRASYWSWKRHQVTGPSHASPACGVSEESPAQGSSCGAEGVPWLGKKSTVASQRPRDGPQQTLTRQVRNAVPASARSRSGTCNSRRSARNPARRVCEPAVAGPATLPAAPTGALRPASPLDVTFSELIVCVWQKRETRVTAGRDWGPSGAVSSGRFRRVKTVPLLNGVLGT